MKKLLLVLAIGAFAACGEGSSEGTEATVDSSASTSTVDTAATIAPADTSAAVTTDTSAVRPDSAATPAR